MYYSIITQRATGVRGWESYSERGKYSPTLFRMRQTRIAASGTLRKPSMFRVIVVGHSRRKARCLCLLLLRSWVFTTESEVNEMILTSDQGMTYNMVAHMGPELNAVL